MRLARFDTLGHQQWALSWGDTAWEHNSAMCLDADGDPIVAVTSGYAFTGYVTIIKYATAQGLTGCRSSLVGPADCPTIVRGVLFLPDARVGSRKSRMELLDVAGRKVLDLHPGANDVRALAPGVYFVRQASGVERCASSVTKVVIAR